LATSSGRSICSSLTPPSSLREPAKRAAASLSFASEVKNLANQAKQATDKIATEIGSLNQVSTDVVGELSAIRAAIAHVDEYVTNTAAAVEEQSTVTTDMSSNTQRAAAALA
jgi:methyl-accepting chemotaxis protein